jgi:hypothetical protein
LPAGTPPPAVRANNTSDQKTRGSLWESSRLNQATGTPPVSFLAQEATATVFPVPGPALTRVNGSFTATDSASDNRGRATRPGGTAGGRVLRTSMDRG